MELDSITPAKLKLGWVVGVDGWNSADLTYIMLSKGSGFSEMPHPNGYHVE